MLSKKAGIIPAFLYVLKKVFKVHIKSLDFLSAIKYNMSLKGKLRNGGGQVQNSESSKMGEYLTGIRLGIPISLGYIPVSIAYAIMARQAGFSVPETCTMSLGVFAGAAQMMAVGMYAQGAGIITIIIATFILNLRHFIMSTCVVNKAGKGNTGLKLIGAFGVTDETFAIFTTQRDCRCTVFSLLGLVTAAYASWNAGTVIGAIASDFLPAAVTVSLGIALYAMFIGIVVPNIKGNVRIAVLVAFTALVNSILNMFISSSQSLIISTLACAAAGVFFVDGKKNDGEAENK